ncbi:MAG TPA: hypothetical protein VE377_03685 [Candidatus Dormibacteraeota bacterium]|nr:hypothetical protein [Candidatus Dormibacteraeota bacterium]
MAMLVAPRITALFTLVVMGGALVSCGGNRLSIPAQTIPNIAGSWEFVAISSSGSVTGIEVALTEGNVLVNGFQQPNGQITATSTQIAFVSLSPTTLNITGFGGVCQPVTSSNALSGAVTATDSPIQFMFTENGNVFNVNGTLSGDGKSVLNGTYTAQSGNTCSTDTGGTITGLAVPKVSGMYAGTMCPLSTTCSSSQDFTDTVTATATENSSSVLTLNLTLTGTDNASLTLTGPVTGNAFLLQGTVQGQTVVYSGYYEVIKNVPSLYLVNATDSASPNYVATLAVQTP